MCIGRVVCRAPLMGLIEVWPRREAITLTMLSDADTRLVTSAARGLLQDLNPEIPARFRTFSQVFSASLGSRRFNVILIGFFGIVALLLAPGGVFGLMAYTFN